MTPHRSTGTKPRSKSRKKPQVQRPAGTMTSGSSEGNTIYRIDREGYVNEVFRESVMILKMIEDPSGSGQLLVATGNEGQIYRVDPASEETIILADLDPEQTPALLAGDDGRVLLGTANPATLVEMTSGYAKTGQYTSAVLDAGQISLWGKLSVISITPDATSVTVEARSGNVEDPQQAAWSAWSTPVSLTYDPGQIPMTPREVAIDCAPARFLQYRLTFVGDGQSTAVVDWVGLKYVVPNLRPAVTGITAKYNGQDRRKTAPFKAIERFRRFRGFWGFWPGGR